MCKRNCIHRVMSGSLAGCCSYHLGGQTRAGILTRRFGKPVTDPEVRMRLMGPFCEFYEYSGEGKDTKTKEPSMKALEKEKRKEKPQWQPGDSFQPAPEEQLRRMYEAGLNDRQIGEALGIDKHSVWLWRKARHLPNNYTDHRNTLDHAEALRLYKSGMIDRQIAAELNVSAQQVYQWRTRNALPTNTGYRGTPEQRDLRAALYFAGMSDREIARRCGKSAAWVSNWRQARKLPRNREPHSNRQADKTRDGFTWPTKPLKGG